MRVPSWALPLLIGIGSAGVGTAGGVSFGGNTKALEQKQDATFQVVTKIDARLEAIEKADYSGQIISARAKIDDLAVRVAILEKEKSPR